MKKLATLIMVGCMTLAISFGFAACKDKACNHKYDNACDAVCNLCEEERAITHKPNADDNDCTNDDSRHIVPRKQTVKQLADSSQARSHIRHEEY